MSLVEDEGRFIPSLPPMKHKFLEEEAKRLKMHSEQSIDTSLRLFTTVTRADNGERFVPAPSQAKRDFFEMVAKKEATFRDPYISCLRVATSLSCELQNLVTCKSG